MANTDSIRTRLGVGLVIPACPLALNAQRRFDERRQRALLRYYLAAGAGGLALGVHTTQFAIRDPRINLFKPVLELAADEFRALRTGAQDAQDAKAEPGPAAFVRIAGLCGPTKQAVSEATIAHDLGYDAGLLSLGALRDADEQTLLAHCRSAAEVLPLVGFYLQPAAGGRLLPFSFWRRFAEIQDVVAIKIAPFNRYQTLDVIRAVAESGRDDVAIYTGNDDNIVVDLLTPFRFRLGSKLVERRVVGGLLGQWAVWTKEAVALHAECRRIARSNSAVPAESLRRAVELTDANAAIFDAANHFHGCIPGIHEVLRRQGLLEGIWCLDPKETLSPGQHDEIDRVCAAYPHLRDDDFVRTHLDQWLRG
jgi:dihydrodipicolinate synthase/N-acetylneuraminate lyase